MNPGSKMYVSTVHDEADVDRTLEAAERALRRVKGLEPCDRQ